MNRHRRATGSEMELHAYIETLKEALKKYGRHTLTCRYRTDPLSIKDPGCICGWTEVQEMLDVKRVTVKWDAGEDPLTDGEITVESLAST